MFTTPLDLREYAHGEWAVLEELEWAGDGEHIVVPRGFITDLASIPKPLRAVLDVNGPSRAPAVLHDWLYCSHIVSRDRADDLLRIALETRGVGVIERNAFWSGVRAFGWLYWNKRKKGLGPSDFAPNSFLK